MVLNWKYVTVYYQNTIHIIPNIIGNNLKTFIALFDFDL